MDQFRIEDIRKWFDKLPKHQHHKLVMILPQQVYDDLKKLGELPDGCIRQEYISEGADDDNSSPDTSSE